MRLYVNPVSPLCRAASIYLVEKAASFEIIELTTGKDRLRLLDISPYGEVPVLQTDGGVIAGSGSICDFADLEYPEPQLVPSDPIRRIACHQLEEVACSTTDALQFLTDLVSYRRPELADLLPGLPDRLDEAVGEHYEFLDATLGGMPFLARSYSRADIFCFTMVSSLVLMRRKIPASRAALTAWFARMRIRPAVARDFERVVTSAAAQSETSDPFFRTDRIHWRSHRVEWACRLGLAPWLAQEIEDARAFFSPPPRGQWVRRPTRQ
jgi:glutathione S-transferase